MIHRTTPTTMIEIKILRSDILNVLEVKFKSNPVNYRKCYITLTKSYIIHTSQNLCNVIPVSLKISSLPLSFLECMKKIS